MKVTFPKARTQDLLDLGRARFADLVVPGDAEVNRAFADEDGDVGYGRERLKVSVELDVRAFEEVEAGCWRRPCVCRERGEY